MYLVRDELTWIARAPAKLNLFLEVIGRRDDGFHELETVVVPIRLADRLSFTSTPPSDDGLAGDIVLNACTLQAVRPPPQHDVLPSASSNLVFRALDLLRKRSNCGLGARIELIKRIPLAAGLGGGSSDAAAALRLANRAWRLNWPGDRLGELAAELGSDVPFFMTNGAAICRGRGERIERLPCMRTLHFVVVKPPLGLRTSDVYACHDSLRESSLSSQSSPTGGLVANLAGGRWGNVRHWMRNRLQAAAAALAPWVREISGIFAKLDFEAHQLSGSGSAYFGVARHAQHARRLATILRNQQLGLVYATRSCQW
jgi:4-diphosphocytidyl-2-C-methyl-D-erythritol kinase